MRVPVIFSPLFLLCYLTIFSQTLPEGFLTQLDAILEKIDDIEGYGPHESLHGLEPYLFEFESICAQQDQDSDDKHALEQISTRLFSRYVYRNGSHRSRIYAEAQRRVLSGLALCTYGKELIQRLSEADPLIASLAHAHGLRLR
jgi:hypothetical protein